MPTEYPIVLVHGIAMKNLGVVKAFGRIGKRLREAGHTVYDADTDGFGTIDRNAAMLGELVQRLTENGGKVNLIAHSKGGLDCRYLIADMGMAEKVASLTTLSTPHGGSRLAAWIYGLPAGIPKFLAFWIDLGYRIFGDRHPDSLAVCRELKEAHNLPLPETVFCQSFSSRIERSRDDFLMAIPHLFTRRCERAPSDGLVAVDASKFGNYRGDCLEGTASHTEIVGYSLRKKKREEVYAFYLALADELAQMGF